MNQCDSHRRSASCCPQWRMKSKRTLPSLALCPKTSLNPSQTISRTQFLFYLNSVQALKEAKELFNSILSSHGSYQRLLSMFSSLFPFPIVRIEPSLTRFTNVPNPLSSPKLIRRAEPLSSEYERQRTLKSMSEAERESLLSESVQIEVCALFCA